MVADLARRAEIPTPRIYLVEDPAPNAFATGRNPAHGVVAVTTGIRALLTDRELRAVLAHEIAHIANRDILIASIAAMIASAVSLLASALQWAALLGTSSHDDHDDHAGGGIGSAIGGIALAIVAPIAATIIQLAISRSREYQADATGARLSGDPLALASALDRLHHGNARVPMHPVGDSPATASLFISPPWQALSAGAVASWFSTHPSTEDRIQRLEAMANAGRRWSS
jgi:heat shock protein HtpX